MKINIRQVIIWFIVFHVCSITVTYILYYGYGYWVDETICITSMLSATGIMAIYYILKDTTRQFFHRTNQRRDFKKWIPCSKRLPETAGRYLVTALRENGDFKKYSIYDAVYGNDGIWHIHWCAQDYASVPNKVIAWQPLPEPYQPKGE